MGITFRWAKLVPSRSLLVPSRSLCGTSPDEFVGRGPQGLPFWVQLLSTLTMWRQDLTVRATGELFGVHERTVRRWRDNVEALILEHGFQPPGARQPIRNVEDLLAYVSETSRSSRSTAPRSAGTHRPAAGGQKAAYSGKTKDYVVNASIIADPRRRPLWFTANLSNEGRTHDITMLRAQTGLLAVLGLVTGAGVMDFADKAYQSLTEDIGLLAVVGTK